MSYSSPTKKIAHAQFPDRVKPASELANVPSWQTFTKLNVVEKVKFRGLAYLEACVMACSSSSSDMAKVPNVASLVTKDGMLVHLQCASAPTPFHDLLKVGDCLIFYGKIEEANHKYTSARLQIRPDAVYTTAPFVVSVVAGPVLTLANQVADSLKKGCAFNVLWKYHGIDDAEAAGGKKTVLDYRDRHDNVIKVDVWGDSSFNDRFRSMMPEGVLHVAFGVTPAPEFQGEIHAVLGSSAFIANPIHSPTLETFGLKPLPSICGSVPKCSVTIKAVSAVEKVVKSFVAEMEVGGVKHGGLLVAPGVLYSVMPMAKMLVAEEFASGNPEQAVVNVGCLPVLEVKLRVEDGQIKEIGKLEQAKLA